ncbi:hypothetical protein GQ44DRAFT_611789 [Phaeosphaeriaceae sp. PMI808]|nr:hypothetical protein GQ44DRAFT_611789 [Phaeosphaeriaceae sp. PMI808]
MLFTCIINLLPLLVGGATYAPPHDLSPLAELLPHSALSAPTGQLKFVVLGIGTQNYTCNSSNESDAPSTSGATALLYDISKLNFDCSAKWKIPTISGLALSQIPNPKALLAYLQNEGYQRIIGHHFFSLVDGINMPIFAFDQLSSPPYPMAQVTLVNKTDAPKFACPGLQGEGAIPWLHLGDNKNISQGGIDTVYRLETAGGKSLDSCKSRKGDFEVPYVAQCK